ncbi:MAG: hypothetical protein AAGI08_12380 [Bacteroidota bacterium]
MVAGFAAGSLDGRMRHLRLETLERRDLLTALRVVAWNTENRPNDAAEEADYATIFEAIGLESVAGNALPVSVLAVQETDLPGSGNDSLGRIESVLDGLYTSTDYATAISGLDGGGDATGFVYDTSQVSLLNTVDLGNADFTHNILRGEFRPADTAGESDFYIYSVHLKSGNSNSDGTIRGNEAAFLRANADALGEGANVLFVGDFNLQGSSEQAWTELVVTPGAGQVRDVADAPGEWNDNPAFLSWPSPLKLIHLL